jgi:hypothetical protein
MAHREVEQGPDRSSEGSNQLTNATWSDVSKDLFSNTAQRGEHIQLANNDSDVSKFFKDINKGINEAVEQSIRDREFVRPERPASTGAVKANELAEDLADRARTGLPKLVHNMPMLSPDGKDQYNKDADRATADIQRREEAIAKSQFDSMSPADQQKMATEKAARDHYNSLTVHRTNPQPPATPTLDKFKADLAKKLEPLEAEREAAYKNLWQDMPIEDKIAILRKREQNKRWQAK